MSSKSQTTGASWQRHKHLEQCRIIWGTETSHGVPALRDLETLGVAARVAASSDIVER